MLNYPRVNTQVMFLVAWLATFFFLKRPAGDSASTLAVSIDGFIPKLLRFEKFKPIPPLLSTGQYPFYEQNE